MNSEKLYLGHVEVLSFPKGKENHTLMAIDNNGDMKKIEGHAFNMDAVSTIVLNSIVENSEGYMLQNTATLPISFINRGVNIEEYFKNAVEMMRMFTIEPLVGLVLEKAHVNLKESKVIDINELHRLLLDTLPEEYQAYMAVSNMLYLKTIEETRELFEERIKNEDNLNVVSLLKQFLHEIEDSEVRLVYVDNRDKNKIKVILVNKENVFIEMAKGKDKETLTLPYILQQDNVTLAIPTIYYLASLHGRNSEEVFAELPSPINFLESKIKEK